MTHKARSVYQPLEQAFIRMPLLPIETWRKTAFASIELSKDPLTHEALYIASPSITAALYNIRALKGKKLLRLQSRLLRYLIRMTSRTTPFGMFSSFSEISIASKTVLEVDSPASYRHKTKLDMEWLMSIVREIEHDSDIQPHLEYFLNPILTRVGNRYYFERSDADSDISETSIVASIGADVLIRKSRSGIRYADLINELLKEVPNATRESLGSFVEEFIRYGIIRSSLQPPVTGTNPIDHILKQLSSIPAAHPTFRQLQSIKKSLSAFDRLAPGHGEEKLRRLQSKTEGMFPSVSGRLPFIVNATAHFTAPATIQRAIAKDAASLTELLARLSPYNGTESALGDYRNDFIEKYGRHRLVPVAEVINQSSGLGFPSHYKSRNKKPKSNIDSEKKYNATLLKMATQAVHEGRVTIELTDTEIESLIKPSFDESSLPKTADVVIQVIAPSSTEVNEGNYRIIPSPISGVAMANRIAGRFADLLSETAVNAMRETAKLQEKLDTDRMYIELVYMPLKKVRAANVILRPALRSFELNVSVNSDLPRENIINLADVYIGVRKDTLYLWSVKFQKELVFSQGHALNPRNAPLICRLLYDIGMDRQSRLLSFSWGDAGKLPMLPRVSYGKFVLALAEWKVELSDIDTVRQPQAKILIPDQKDWHKKIKKWRQKWQVPQYVLIVDKDNRLLLDLDQESHSMEVFHTLIAGGSPQTITIQESLTGPDNVWVKGKDGHYVSEFVFQLRKIKSETAQLDGLIGKKASPIVQSVNIVERTKLPGSEWVYLKLYFKSVQTIQEDEYLTSYLSPLLKYLTAHNLTTRWFFVRYADPINHIRVRLKIAGDMQRSLVLAAFYKWALKLQQDDILNHFSVDTYDREIERYGGVYGIDLAESIFYADSVSATRSILLLANKLPNDVSNVQLAALTATAFLAAFGYDDKNLASWPRAQTAQSHTFVEGYRKDRDFLLTALRTVRENTNDFQDIKKIYHALLLDLQTCGEKYLQLEKMGQLTVTVDSLVASFLHMHANRYLGIDQKLEEKMLTYMYKSILDYPKWHQGKSAI